MMEVNQNLRYSEIFKFCQIITKYSHFHSLYVYENFRKKGRMNFILFFLNVENDARGIQEISYL